MKHAGDKDQSVSVMSGTDAQLSVLVLTEGVDLTRVYDNCRVGGTQGDLLAPLVSDQFHCCRYCYTAHFRLFALKHGSTRQLFDFSTICTHTMKA